MEQFSVVEGVEQAVQTEKLGYQFYTSMAGKFKESKELAELFTFLADKEVLHEKRFSELKETVKDTTIENGEEVAQYMRAIVESEFFLGKNKSLPALDHVDTVAGAVKFAIGFEKETLLYFYEIRNHVADKKTIDAIIDEERSHIIWLSKFEMGLARLT
ncbi:MAG: ferritin family protein [Nitrospirae bacterium]|nr:ferritin family protein [Nitrospirota bacterium]